MDKPTENEHHFFSEDGLSIFYRHWPACNETARLVVAHGLGEHSGRYTHVLTRFAQAGLSVWAPDHRGHGRSEGQRGHVDTFDQYIRDLNKMVGIAKQNMPPDMKVFLLGHSMGGLIALSFVENYWGIADGVIVSSPALRPGVEVPLIKGAVARFLSRIWPTLSFDNQLDSKFLSHDSAVVRDYGQDPLVHGKITARWFTEFLTAMRSTIQAADAIRIPVLMQVAGDDRLVDAKASKQFFTSLPTGDKTLFFYDRLYHEIYNEKDEDGETVLKDLDQWIYDRI